MLDASEGLALFTDGSASNKDRSGGWAWLSLDAFSGIEKASGAEQDTTISRMELQAVIDGLEYVHDRYGPTDVLVYSDSEYVVKGASDRHRKRNANQDLWKRLDSAVDFHNYVAFEHVKGHSGHPYNELCDDLAGQARKESLSAAH